MTDSNLPLSSFAIGGYRSFGKSVQRFGVLSQINLFIGQNNCGKSNILRFLYEVYPKLSIPGDSLGLLAIDRHIPYSTGFIAGTSVSLSSDSEGQRTRFINEYASKVGADHKDWNLDSVFILLNKKAELDKSGTEVWFDFTEKKERHESNWSEAFNAIDNNRLISLWSSLTNRRGGDRNHHWVPETLNHITPKFKSLNVKMIPAIRQIGKQGSVSDEFSGEGIIERLAKIQNPDVLNQKDKEKFERINLFLRNVIDNQSASIEVPHARDTIHVHMDGKTLPLESLGTGIHEVIILAAAATILENTAICMEEPELHLNPLLQKKLMRYLQEATNNQYFITTHSAALMDTPSAEVYHISIKNGESIAERATSDKQRSSICEDLGYHPSDLLQSNCIIWVEGPSDRIYINHWITELVPHFIEGIHYSIMFYGGRLASHLSGEDIDKNLDEFISLRRLNRRGVIVIDSDKAKKGARINTTKQRLQSEFDTGPGHAWITAGREIENYLEKDKIEAAISHVHPSAKSISAFGQYDKPLAISNTKEKDTQASKVEVARYIVEHYSANLDVLDLKKQVQKLINFIKDSNPSTHIAS